MDIPNRPTLEELIQQQLTRRKALQGMAAAGALLAASANGSPSDASELASTLETTLDFQPVPHVYPKRPEHAEASRTIGVADNYTAQVLLRWGDPLFPDSPEFSVTAQTPQTQQQQFGYNNDFVGFIPLPLGSNNSDHGLLCVNHEYTNPELMFPGIQRATRLEQLTPEQLAIEQAAHGMSVVEIRRAPGGRWHVVRNSAYNRRITAGGTRMRISGPAAGHERMKTSRDPKGTEVLGTLNNCAGGLTPWGTVLSGEENFPNYFHGPVTDAREAGNYKSYGITGDAEYAWHTIDSRFDLQQEPREPNRFGWVVEIDPYDPTSVPVKRTALGRLRHEGAATTLSHDGRVVVYMGDDQRFQYLYKFVTNRPYDPVRREANRDLLDDGTLYVAQFQADNLVRWLPLVWNQGPLTAENGFGSQADVLIETRRAAELLGATPMDRPEDVEANPVTGNVFVLLTNNSARTSEQVTASNPRPENVHGHILELPIPRRDGKPDHTALEHRWEVFLLAGDAESGGWYGGGEPDSWLSCPDNCAFDPQGRLWITTDGAQDAAGFTDGVYACETAGPQRARTRQFFRAPVGAEICGPCFTPDGHTLFVAIQHPGEGSTLDQPSTRWPNPPLSPLPPMPAVVAISRREG